MMVLENVTKIYRIGTFGGKRLKAVDDVSFEIDEGEIVSLIGESGSGKTTIGKMILRLIRPTSGRILFNGKDIGQFKKNELKDYYRKVQGVFQDPFSSYNPLYKVDRIFDIAREEFFPDVGRNEWKNRIEEKLRSVGLNPLEVLGKFPHQLSGGQLQRLLIARALVMNVKFLVADEIISMLDASTRIDVLNLLAELKDSGLSILFITHDLSLGYYISDKTVILYRGSIMEYGDTEKIFNSPAHPYTISLMESIPRIDERWRMRSAVIQGKEKSIRNGRMCKFYHRCFKGDESCVEPPLIEVEKDHFVRCSKIGT
ncbi:MAG TPA: ABC transporter ATP-binding protein [Thermotogales bacterium]|nr:ABC transporter ATP-binding protein [Thermotogales bacterium]